MSLELIRLANNYTNLITEEILHTYVHQQRCLALKCSENDLFTRGSLWNQTIAKLITTALL